MNEIPIAKGEDLSAKFEDSFNSVVKEHVTKLGFINYDFLPDLGDSLTWNQDMKPLIGLPFCNYLKNAIKKRAKASTGTHKVIIVASFLLRGCCVFLLCVAVCRCDISKLMYSYIERELRERIWELETRVMEQEGKVQ